MGPVVSCLPARATIGAMSRARSALAASIVVTVSGACGASGGGSHTSKPSLYRNDDGTCRYSAGFSCPAGASCNPPPPAIAECPPEMRDGDTPEGPTRPGKVRIEAQLYAAGGQCTFVSDYFCAMPPAAGCDEPKTRQFACRELNPEAGGTRVHHVDGFVAPRADGSCGLYPSITCVGGCDLPEPAMHACDAAPPSPSLSAEGDAPTPYTADEIREATLPGRRYVWRIEEDGKPPTTRVLVFERVDAQGAELVAGPDDASLGEASPKRVTWEELRKHALFPAKNTSIQRERITVPAGELECRVYTVKDDDGTLRRFYFADDLPGAPVLHFTEKQGHRVSTTTLVEHTPGKAAAGTGAHATESIVTSSGPLRNGLTGR